MKPAKTIDMIDIAIRRYCGLLFPHSKFLNFKANKGISETRR